MTFLFIKHFFITLYYLSPVLLALVLSIVLLGIIIGRLENWARLDSIYYAFITATTVGYGDFHPTRKLSKFLAIIDALIGLVTTGILGASAVNSITYAAKMSGLG